MNGMKTLLPFLLICSQSAVCGILVPESTDEQQPLFTPPQESVVSVSLPLWANNPNITDFGFFPGGTILLIVVSGTVNLGVPAINTLPDGSLTQPVPFADCGACWVPGYKYFIQNATYPQVAGGDGTNHFPGGGGNYDSVAGDHSPWAAQGPITTDTTNPQAVRFGEVAGTFSANPVPNSSDWFAVGFGGAFQVPPGGAELGLVIADTYYSNNVGSYAVTVSEIPEACSAAMVLIGLLSLAIVAAVRAARPVTYFPALRAPAAQPPKPRA
jgi:hypothetical protein